MKYLHRNLRTQIVISACTLIFAACTSASLPVRADHARFESEVAIPVAGHQLPGTMYVAGGEGPHSTLVWFHGFPGLPSPTDATIDALRSKGLNVLYLHYRGAWGAPGAFSAAHALEDASAAMAFTRSSQAAASYRVDSDIVIPVGDSFGSWIALSTAAADPLVPCAAGALVLNLGRLGTELSSNEEMRGAFGQMFSQVDDDPQLAYQLESGADAFMHEIITEQQRYDLSLRASALNDRPILLIGAADDDLAPVSMHLEPVAAAYRNSGASVTSQILPGGHDLLDSDYADLLADWVNRDCR